MQRERSTLLGITLGLAFLAPSLAHAVPSFARQTGLSCEDCHTQFPELTQMGRNFKLSGYSFGASWVKKDAAGGSDDPSPTAKEADSVGAPSLPPISAMLQASYTVVRSQPNALSYDAGAGADKRGTAELPQQASLFLAGELAPDFGAFVQMTMDSSGAFGFDNTDVRYAHVMKVDKQPLILGLDMNNNPTVQDVWNSTPAWGSPYTGPDVALDGPNSPQISSLGGGVMGAGGYVYYGNLVYLELSGYRSSTLGAPAGGAMPTIIGTAPYWRVALLHEKDEMSYMVGAYGLGMDQMASSAAPDAPANHYDDVAGDFQVQYVGDPHIASATGSYTHEHANLAGTQGNLDVAKVTGSYLYNRTVGASVNYTDTRVDGASATDVLTYQLDYLLSLNVKFSLQYAQCLSLYGTQAGSAYAPDPSWSSNGRHPEDNNTFLAQAWMLF
jgi:hypothetical protein